MVKLLRHPKVIRWGILLARGLIRLLLATCRLKIEGLDTFISTAKERPCILVLWHSQLAIIADILARQTPKFIYASFISNSRDGEPLAQLATSYPNGRVIRVPHNSRHFALKEAIEFLNAPGQILIITPDGPRGPAEQVKPGVAVAALQSQATIVSFGWKSSKLWRLNTWDKMRFPKPFSTIKVSFGTPFTLSAEQTLREQVELLQEHLKTI